MPACYDVAIVGMGPVGTTLAAILGRQGLSVVALDKSDDIFPLPRAIGFDHEIMRTFQNIGLAETIRPHITPYRPTEYRGLNDVPIARFESLPPPYPLGWNPSYVFTQPPVERALRATLVELPTVDVRLSTEVLDLAEQDDHVLVALSGGRAASTLRARYVVACDGGASPIRTRMGIELESLDFDESWLVIDVLVDEDKLDILPADIIQYCDPERPATYVVGPGNHRRWEIRLLPDKAPADLGNDETIWGLLDRWLTPQDGTLWRSAPYVFHALVAREWRRGRILLAGDAAHMTPPFMAQGMCQGIRDAGNLAWKLNLVLTGKADAALLDSYEAERRPHVSATTMTAKDLGRMISETDPVKAAERDAKMLAEHGNPPAVQFRQNLIPGLVAGALSEDQGAPVGLLLPQPLVATQDGPRLMDDVVEPGFRLVLAPSVAAGSVPTTLLHQIAALGGTVVRLAGSGTDSVRDEAGRWNIVETQGVLQTWLDRHEVIAVLVRPDHYVMACAHDAGELCAMETGIARHLCLTGAAEKITVS